MGIEWLPTGRAAAAKRSERLAQPKPCTHLRTPLSSQVQRSSWFNLLFRSFPYSCLGLQSGLLWIFRPAGGVR